MNINKRFLEEAIRLEKRWAKFAHLFPQPEPGKVLLEGQRLRNEFPIEHVGLYAIHNRPSLEKTNKCGCYHCLTIFNPKDIKEWVDNDDTAMCPYCEIDSVIPESNDYFLTIEFLTQAKEHYFK
jgi:hypothetical protein